MPSGPASAPSAAAEDDLPSSSEGEEDEEEEISNAPLLGKGAAKLPSSDAVQRAASESLVEGAPAVPPQIPESPRTPREKLREKGRTTPLTPRSASKALDVANQDPAAAAQAAASAIADADPAAAQVIEAARAAVADPKAAAIAAAEALKNVKPPTAEELAAARDGARQEATQAIAAVKDLFEEMMNDRPPPLFPMADVSDRMTRYVDMLVDAIPEGRLPATVQENLKPGIILCIKISSALAGWIAFIIRWAMRIWDAMPKNVVQICFGAALCYFGGTFVTTIAAAEAFRTMGYERARDDVVAVIEAVKPVLRANEEDDQLDEDGDGQSDVDQLTPPQLLQRKVLLIAGTIKEPERIKSAVASLYTALLAVLATLRLEFAQTAAMAMGIADMVKKPLIRVGKPALEPLLPPQTHHWIAPVLDACVRLIAISAALYLYQIISAFYSALRGGKLAADGLFNLLVEKARRGVVLCPGMVDANYDPEDSILDDAIGWIMALQGFLFQLNTNFAIGFPFNIILAPLTAVETYLKLQITTSSVSGEGGTARRQLHAHNCVGCCISPAYMWNITAGVK